MTKFRNPSFQILYKSRISLATTENQHSDQKQLSLISTMNNERCKGCVFEYRYSACPHDVERCKKVIRELQNIKFSENLGENNPNTKNDGNNYIMSATKIEEKT